MSLVVPAAGLAKGWLAVAACSTKSGAPALDKAVYVEQYPHGLRLTATDSYMVLTAWVPEIGHDLDPEPSADEIPYASAVAQDPYGRAGNLLAHLLRLARSKDDDSKPLDLDLVVSLNVPWQPEGSETDDLQLDGFQAMAVTIEHPNSERVQLGVYEGEWVKYRQLFAAFKMQRPMRLAITQHVAASLAKAAKVFGPATVVYQRFGGETKPVHVTFGDEPTVSGLVMPCRWDFDSGQPWGQNDEEVDR
jgi:hypothetical protein